VGYWSDKATYAHYSSPVSLGVSEIIVLMLKAVSDDWDRQGKLLVAARSDFP
jgi:hypothetical protein